MEQGSDQGEVSPQRRFEAIAADYAGRPGVTRHGGLMSASAQLRIREKIFAMLVQDRLVVKIPADAVDRLIGADVAEPFRTAGRVMREWASLDPAISVDWSRWVAEAYSFVGEQRSPAGRRPSGRDGTAAPSSEADQPPR